MRFPIPEASAEPAGLFVQPVSGAELAERAEILRDLRVSRTASMSRTASRIDLWQAIRSSVLTCMALQSQNPDGGPRMAMFDADAGAEAHDEFGVRPSNVALLRWMECRLSLMGRAVLEEHMRRMRMKSNLLPRRSDVHVSGLLQWSRDDVGLFAVAFDRERGSRSAILKKLLTGAEIEALQGLWRSLHPEIRVVLNSPAHPLWLDVCP